MLLSSCLHMPIFSLSIPLRVVRWTLTCGAVVLLGACAAGSGSARHDASETFDSTTTHAQLFAATEAQTCEAARRALLSQGYFVSRSGEDQVSGRKQFQPAGDVHLDVEFRVVCAPDQRNGQGAIAFATAVQDRYELKKSSSSASVGVGAIGSLSLPFSAGNDAMVKVASQTVTNDEFYARFFVLLGEYLYVPESPKADSLGRSASGQTEPDATPPPMAAPISVSPAANLPVAAPAAAAVPLAPLPPSEPDTVPVLPSSTRG